MGYQLVETIEVGSGGAASIEFTGIPQDGVDLVCVLSARGDDGALLGTSLSCNSNLISDVITLIGNQNGAESNSSYDVFGAGSTFTANTFASIQFYFSNYATAASTPISIEVANENNGSPWSVSIHSAIYSTAEAITSLTLGVTGTYGNSDFVQYSTASLYKITAD